MRRGLRCCKAHVVILVDALNRLCAQGLQASRLLLLLAACWLAGRHAPSSVSPVLSTAPNLVARERLPPSRREPRLAPSPP